MREGWEVKKLGEVCDIISGSTPSRSNKEFWDNGSVSWFTVDDIRKQGRRIKYTVQTITAKALKETSIRLLPINTVLLCCTASVGEYAITEIELTTNQQFNGLVVKNKKELLPEFLFYYASTLKDKLLSVSGKTTIDFVSQSKVKEFQISLPTISEQQHIVSILDETFIAIDQAKANVQKNLNNIKELFQTQLNNIFSERDNEWQQSKLVDVCSLITCGVASTPKYVESSVGIPFLSAQNVKNGEVLLDKYNYISKSFHEELTKKNKPEKGDILYSRVGAKYGEAGIVEHDFDFSIYVSLTLIKPLHEILNNYFLKYLLNSPLIKSLAKKSIKSSGVPNLNVKDVREFTIRFPPIKQQKQIVNSIREIYQEIQKLEKHYEQKLEKIEDLKNSILDKAFKGELTTTETTLLP